MEKEIKPINPAILIICSVFILIITALFSIKIFATNENKSIPQAEKVQVIRNHNPIDIDEILLNNINNEIIQEMVVQEIDLEYTTEYKNNSDLPRGTIQVIQEGRDGKQNAVIIKKYKNGELISEELVAENLIKSSVNKIVEIGTGSGTNNYKVKVGDTVYVTSKLLSVRLEADSNSEKLCTLKRGASVKIQQINGDWLYILSKEHNGYIPKECITNINPNQTNIQDYNAGESYSKNSLLAKLSFNMNLNNSSGFSIEQFKKVLSGQESDKNKVFEEAAEYFYYAEKQYGINGVFLAAVGIHESAWGTSKISKDKKNLFGYGAVDSNPYNGAYSFNTYAEGIDLLARVFVKYYLNPNGTVIYGGNVANGKFYNGNTISSVNIKYASDKNWANSVYKWMKYLYNSL